MDKLEIELKLENKNDFYNNYNKNRINPNIISYIMEECYGESLSKGVTINISASFSITDNDKIVMEEIIRNNYDAKIKDENYYWNREKALGLMLLGLGIIFILIYYLGIKRIEVLSELTLILGWLAIWESIFSIISNCLQRRMKIKRYTILKMANIIIKKAESNMQ